MQLFLLDVSFSKTMLIIAVSHFDKHMFMSYFYVNNIHFLISVLIKIFSLLARQVLKY